MRIWIEHSSNIRNYPEVLKFDGVEATVDNILRIMEMPGAVVLQPVSVWDLKTKPCNVSSGAVLGDLKASVPSDW